VGWVRANSTFVRKTPNTALKDIIKRYENLGVAGTTDNETALRWMKDYEAFIIQRGLLQDLFWYTCNQMIRDKFICFMFWFLLIKLVTPLSLFVRVTITTVP
jgi:hypothetical protein